MTNILVHSFRSSLGDCSNNGLTERFDSMYLFIDCDEKEAIAYCNEKNIIPENQLILNKRELWGEPHWYAEPLVKPVNMAQTFGGNFVYTSDSRMPAPNGIKAPLPVHDRFDTWSDFDTMTR